MTHQYLRLCLKATWLHRVRRLRDGLGLPLHYVHSRPSGFIIIEQVADFATFFGLILLGREKRREFSGIYTGGDYVREGQSKDLGRLVPLYPQVEGWRRKG